MAKSPKAPAAVEEVVELTAKKPAGKKKLIIIVAAALLLGGGGSGGAWFMLKGKHSVEGEAQAKTVKEAKHAKKDGPPVFLPLEAIVVNLRAQPPQGNDQFLQTDITLRLAGPEVVEEVKLHMPEVRNRVIMLLSSKTSLELLTAEGKSALAESLRTEITAVIDPESVKTPLLTKDAGGPADASEDEKAGKAAEEAPAEEAEAPASPEEFKVKSVLFTSFIIQ
jgi:flagellar FliL protein